MQARLFPLDRAEIGENTIHLGMERDSVFAILGKGESFHDRRYYYFNRELAIDFDHEDKVKFIEILGGIDGMLHPSIYGISAFEEDAEKVVDVLKQMNHGSIDDSERGYCISFLEISVGLYRQSTPKNVMELIEEAARDGNPMDDKEIAAEMRNATHWATIGIGINSYYRQIPVS